MFILYDREATILDIYHPKPEFLSGNTANSTTPEEPFKEISESFTAYFHIVCQTRQSQRFIFSKQAYGNEKKHYYEVFLSCLGNDYILADIRTIHEESLAQIESEHLQLFFAEVLNNLPIPVTVKSIDTGRYIYWSKKAEILGHTAADMIGTTEACFMLPKQIRILEQITRKLIDGEEKQNQRIEKYILTDKKEHTFIVTRTLLQLGTKKLILGSAFDISELKETQASLLQARNELENKNMTLTSALKLAKVIPWNCDLEKRILYCDYKTHHPEEAGKPDKQGHYAIPLDCYFDNIHPDYREEVIQLFNDLIQGKQDEINHTCLIHFFNHRDWDWIQVQSSISRRRTDKTPIQLIGSVQCVTDRKNTEEALLKAKEEADRSNKFKSAFLANMSHEIRTPLNTIVGFSELMCSTEDQQEKQEYFSIIQNSNTLLLKLIGDILDLSKIEAGTLEFTFDDHDLDTLMQELEQTATLKVNNPAVKVTCTGSLPGHTIHTDRGRLVQVLHNFINNAAKFTETGHIHFGCTQQPDGQWYFYVEDSGSGIAADHIANIFNRFVKLDPQVKGTGLGLAISKSIIERLGGQIGANSIPGQGSTFWFTLPAESITPPASHPETKNNS